MLYAGRIIIPWRDLASYVLLAGSLLLSACQVEPGGDAPPDGSDPLASLANLEAQATQDCLPLVWGQQGNPDRKFDRSHDEVSGGTISCVLGTSPSVFSETLETISSAAASGDTQVIRSQMRLPFLYIDAKGNRRELTELSDADLEQILSRPMLTLMQDLALGDTTVVPDQGAFFALGAIWLSVDTPGGPPRIVTVNQQALAEYRNSAP